MCLNGTFRVKVEAFLKGPAVCRVTDQTVFLGFGVDVEINEEYSYVLLYESILWLLSKRYLL